MANDKSGERKRGWNVELNQDLHLIADVDTATEQVIRLTVVSYNDGPPKIGMMRTGVLARSGERYYRKLGRLTLEEAANVTAALEGFIEELRAAHVVTDEGCSTKRFSKWLDKHAEPPQDEDKPKKRPAKKDADDESDATDPPKGKKGKERVVEDDDEPMPRKKLKRKLPRR